MATSRSPNYPNLSLAEALVLARDVYKAERRSKMSREVLAAHLGYSSLSGRALAKIGALRAYGLIEGTGDDSRISDDAFVVLEAPADDPEQAAALRRCAMRPAIFREIAKDFPDHVSEQNLRYWLMKRGYNGEAAGKAIQTYLATMQLVEESSDPYNPDLIGDEEEPDMDALLATPQKAASAGLGPAPQTAREQPTAPGMRKFVINLPDGGDATLTYPGDLTAVGYQDLEDYLQLFFKKAKRAAKPDDDSDIA